MRDDVLPRCRHIMIRGKMKWGPFLGAMRSFIADHLAASLYRRSFDFPLSQPPGGRMHGGSGSLGGVEVGEGGGRSSRLPQTTAT